MQLFTIGNYATRRATELAALENNLPYVYVDTAGIATIGVGVNLRPDPNQQPLHALHVLELLGFDVAGSVLTGAARDAEQAYIALLVDALAQPYPFLQGQPPPEQNAARAALDLILGQRAINPIYDGAPAAFPARVTQFTLPAGGGVTLLDDLLDGYTVTTPTAVLTFDGYEDGLDDWLQQVVSGTSVAAVNPGLSNRDNTERLALLSLHWNGVLARSENLRAALIADNRAEAWFEIRYRSNSLAQTDETRKGIANRRYAEADLFGLYGPDPTQADYLAAYRMYTRHSNERISGQIGLLGYESTTAANPANNFDPPPLTIEQKLQPAAFALRTAFGAPANLAWDHIIVAFDQFLTPSNRIWVPVWRHDEDSESPPCRRSGRHRADSGYCGARHVGVFGTT